MRSPKAQHNQVPAAIEEWELIDDIHGPCVQPELDGLERDIRLLEASIAREEIEFGALCRLQQSTLEVQILQGESELRLQQLHIQLGYLTQRKWTMPVTTTPLLKCRF